MADYASYSYWLETTADDLTPRPPLTGSSEVDVAILGGGYSGLWTAYYLLRQNPRLQVALVEKEIVGFGASGETAGGARRDSRRLMGLDLRSRKWGRRLVPENGASEGTLRLA